MIAPHLFRAQTMLDIHTDTREEPSGIPRLLRDRYGDNVLVRHLPVADYVVGHLGIERKTSADLVQSIADGRVFDQARRLSQAFPRAALIIEGLFPPASCEGREEGYFACLSTLAWSFGIRIFPTRFSLDSALLIHSLVQAEFDQVAGVVVTSSDERQCKKRHRTDRRLFLLQGFFGIGPERARNLIRSFGSLRSVFCAPMEAWLDVPGIGPRLARQMHDLLDDTASVEKPQDRNAG